MTIDVNLNIKLHNVNLEVEYYGAKILAGYRYEQDYLNFIITLSKMPILFLDGQTEFNSSMLDLINLVFVGDDKVWSKGFFQDKITSLQTILYKLYIKSNVLASQMQQDFINLQATELLNLVDNIKILKFRKEMMAQIIGNAPTYDTYYPHRENILAIRQVKEFSQSLLQYLSTLTFESPKLILSASDKSDVKKIRIYLDSITSDLANGFIFCPGSIAAKVAHINSLLVTAYPTYAQMLDPYHIESYIDGFNILCNPKKLYTNILTDKIINSDIGVACAIVFPEFYTVAMNKLLNNFDELDYNVQQRIKIYSGIGTNDSLLIQQVNQAIMITSQTKPRSLGGF